MEGYSLDECITEQRRLNDRHQRGKRQYDTQERGEELDESQAKAARIDTDPNDAIDNGTAVGGSDADADDAAEKGNDAIMERWYGMRGK
jgi:hypothetical protein